MISGQSRPGKPMAGRKPYEFFLLRYVPNAVREEFVNIGVVMTESGGDGGGYAGVHFTKDWRRARCLNPAIDVEMLDAVGREIQSRIANVQDRAMLLHEMMDRYSNAIQISPARQCLTENPVEEMRELASSLVETPNFGALADIDKRGKSSGVRWIRSGMRREFQAAGVWDQLEKDLPASPYSVENDPLTFDFAYGVSSEIKLFQAVSFVERPQEAVDFAYHYADIAPNMAIQTGRKPLLTAVVEDAYDDENDKVRHAIALMGKKKITLVKMAEMASIAETARVELRA